MYKRNYVIIYVRLMTDSDTVVFNGVSKVINLFPWVLVLLRFDIG